MSEIEKYYNGEIHVDFEDTLLEITPELMKKTIVKQDEEIERLKSIIKEVREYATQHMMELAKRKGINGEENGAIYVAVADLVEILDKGE